MKKILTHAEIMDKFKSLGLIVNDKPISLNAFKKLCDMHYYGRSYKILFIHNAKDNMLGFYLMKVPNTLYIKESYDMFKQMVAGDMSFMEYDAVQWGNCGIPIQYGDLRSY
jgi:hypothetical protein